MNTNTKHQQQHQHPNAKLSTMSQHKKSIKIRMWMKVEKAFRLHANKANKRWEHIMLIKLITCSHKLASSLTERSGYYWKMGCFYSCNTLHPTQYEYWSVIVDFAKRQTPQFEKINYISIHKQHSRKGEKPKKITNFANSINFSIRYARHFFLV